MIEEFGFVRSTWSFVLLSLRFCSAAEMAFTNYELKDWMGKSSAASNHGYSEMRLPSAQLAGFRINARESDPKIVCIENLGQNITEEFLFTLFGQIGLVKKAKLFADGTSRYAFLKFADHQSASQCVIAMDRKFLHNREIRVSWATEHDMQPTNGNFKSQFHVFVGDLSADVDNKTLYEAFADLGDVTDVKVIRDPLTSKSKGYGFVTFAYREQAAIAIEKMNGHVVGSRPIRTNWATRKSSLETNGNSATATMEEICKQTGPENTSVYVGNVPNSCFEGDIRLVFKQFGEICKVRHFKHLGYSFVTYTTKQAAARAILEMNGRSFFGQLIKCSWGKGDMSDNGKGQGRADLPSYYDSNSLSETFNGINMSAIGLCSSVASSSANINSYWNLFQQYCQNLQFQDELKNFWVQKNIPALK